MPGSIVQSQHTNVIFLIKADLSSHPSTWEAEAHEELDKCPREREQHDRLNRDPLASLHSTETPSSPCKPKDTCQLSPSQCSFLTTPCLSSAQRQGPGWCLENIPAQGLHFSAPHANPRKPTPARSLLSARPFVTYLKREVLAMSGCGELSEHIRSDFHPQHQIKSVRHTPVILEVTAGESRVAWAT